ncbi:MAG: hypothetical protein QW165_04115 [Candidatus Woesearchaeota archaeon]
MTGHDIRLVQGSRTYKIYQLFLEKGALTRLDIQESFPDLNGHHISKYFSLLVEKGLIVRSAKRFQSPVRKEASMYVYGLNEKLIEQRAYELTSSVEEDSFLSGIRKEILELIRDSPLGLTTAEVMFELRKRLCKKEYENWDYVGWTIRDFVLDKSICRSSFRLPSNAMIHGRKPGYVYGRDQKAVFDKVLKLMPKEVRQSFLDIVQSNEIYPVDVLSKRFGIDDQTLRMWYYNRILPAGWVKTYSHKQRRYFYNPAMSEEFVAERVPKIHEEIVINSILENSKLGDAFEKQAVFYFVWYLILKRGRQIRLNSDFPKKIPSWFSRDDVRNPAFVVLDKEGNPSGKTLVDVWKFDNEPFDYLIFTYDDVLESPSEGYVISIKRDQNRKYLGTAGKRYIAAMYGCLSLGMSLDCRQLPKRALTPVLIVNGVNSDKLFSFAHKINCEVFYRSRFQKVVDFVNSLGIKYSDDAVLSKLREEFELFEKYQNHENVLLGKVTPEQLVRLKR